MFMKKNLSNKQLAITVFIVAVLLFIICLIHTMSLQAVALAYGGDVDGEIYYSSVGNARKETESFGYVTKTVESYSINTTFPNYFNNNGSLQNTCSNVAGANIIGYYDRYYENLIPNSVPGVGTTKKYTYYPMSKNMVANQAVINDLYNKMLTNITAPGSTQVEYKNGLSSYVQNKGYNISFNTVITNGLFDLNKAKVQLQNGYPISLYMSGYGFTKITDNGSLVTLDKSLYDDNHIAVVYGFDKINYFGANGNLLRSEIYLKVSTGIYGVSGVYIVNNYGTLNDAESVIIS